jgi:hypothetical protein
VKPFKLSPKAEELLAGIEAREAAKKAAGAHEPDNAPAKQPEPVVGWGPNPLDTLGKVGFGK